MRNANLVVLGSIVALAVLLVEPALAQECSGNADCASPLTCKASGSRCSQGASVLPDGGISTSEPVCEPMPSKCTWVFVRCQAESDCGSPEWACIPAPDQVLIKMCFPKAIACPSAQACPAGWSCLDLGQSDDGHEALKIWNPGKETQFCWPDGLKAVLDRTARTDASGLALPSSGSDGTAASLKDAGTAAPESASKSSGCAMGGRPGASSFQLVVLAVALGVLRRLSVRRRRSVPGTASAHQDRDSAS